MADLAELVWVQTDSRLSELYDLSSKAAWKIRDQLKLSPPQSQAAHKYGSLKDSTRKSRFLTNHVLIFPNARLKLLHYPA